MTNRYIMGIGGNIIDDEKVHIAKWKSWYEKHIGGGEEMTPEAWEDLWKSLKLSGIGDNGTNEKPGIYNILSEGKNVPTWKETETFLNDFYIENISAKNIVPGFIDPFLLPAIERGDQIVPLSNAPRALVDAQIAILGLTAEQRSLILDISQEELPAGVRKPAVEAYRFAMDMADTAFGAVTGAVVAIDNMPKIVAGAREAGLFVALVNPTAGTGSTEGITIFPDWYQLGQVAPDLSKIFPKPSRK